MPRVRYDCADARMKQLDLVVPESAAFRMHLRGQILTKLVGSIVTRGPSVCDGAHVSDDGHERARERGTWFTWYT